MSSEYAMKSLLEGLEEIGHTDVDSGQTLIVDPCYVLRDERWHDTERATYTELLASKDARNWPDVLPFHNGFVLSNFVGDGSYPIYVRRVEGGIAQIVIDFEQLLGEVEDDYTLGDEEEVDLPDDLAA